MDSKHQYHVTYCYSVPCDVTLQQFMNQSLAISTYVLPCVAILRSVATWHDFLHIKQLLNGHSLFWREVAALVYYFVKFCVDLFGVFQMDQYPDENEEFELQYQDELELLEDIPHEYDGVVVDGPSTSRQALEKQQQMLSKTPGPVAGLKDISRLSNSTLNSPQLSQITFGASQGEPDIGGGGPVNRRLFGTPRGQPAGRGCSTPLQRMPPIAEVASTCSDSAAPMLNAAAEQLQQLDMRNPSKRRLERDLFGDIDDLFHESYEDPMVKKARTEEQRDNEAIERILELRQKMRETSKTVRHDEVSRLKALHDFKMKNLSYNLPSWPFLALQRSDLERLYVRYHSEDYERRQLELLSVRGDQIGSLLGEAKEQVWREANELVSGDLSKGFFWSKLIPCFRYCVAWRPQRSRQLWQPLSQVQR